MAGQLDAVHAELLRELRCSVVPYACTHAPAVHQHEIWAAARNLDMQIHYSFTAKDAKEMRRTSR